MVVVLMLTEVGDNRKADTILKHDV